MKIFQYLFKNIIYTCQKKCTLSFGKLLIIKQKPKQKNKTTKTPYLKRPGKALNGKIQAWYCVRGQADFQKKNKIEINKKHLENK